MSLEKFEKTSINKMVYLQGGMSLPEIVSAHEAEFLQTTVTTDNKQGHVHSLITSRVFKVTVVNIE